MDPLSGAASVIAVIQISEAVASICFQYLKAVKDARPEIERLQGELSRLKTVLDGAQKLLDGPNGASLQTSQGLRNGLTGCSSQLEELKAKLEKKLDVGKRGKIMSQFGLRALKWPFESKDVDAIIHALERYRDTVSAGLVIDQGALLLDSLERIKNEERLDILEWISLVQYGKHHDTVKEARTSGTCEWLLQHKIFRKWEDTNSSVVMWLQGSPGSGKTFLTSKVIDHVQSQFKTSSPEGFAFFYCNQNEKERREPLSILRSYVRQLSTATKYPEDMRKKLRDLRVETRKNGSDLSFDMCREQLLESVNLYPKTTLVLDALDECEPDSRGRLVDTIEFLLSKSKRPLKVFISSRPDRDIRRRFINRPNLEIEARHNEADIRRFVDEEIKRHESWGEMSPSLQEEIVRVLLDRSQGMFQWVYLQIKEILSLETNEAIRDRLGKLPSGLKATYDEIYGKIKARNKHDKTLVERAIKWVMCTYKPFNSEELLSAIRLDPEKDTVCLSDKITESQLQHLCNNLLVLDSQRKVWRFSHLSVTEYFEEIGLNLRRAHCYAAKVCLVLLMDQTGTFYPSDSRRFGEPRDLFYIQHPFQRYSRHHWITHVQTQEGQETDLELVRLLKIFLGSPSESTSPYRAWHDHIGGDNWGSLPSTSSFRGIGLSEISPKDTTIFTMCRFSFYTLLLEWWDNAEIALSQMNSYGEDLLTVAVKGGCKPICEVLIKRGIQVNVPTQKMDNAMSLGLGYGSALIAAAARGETKICEFLVEKGADLNMPLQSGNYGSVLAAAVRGGESEIIKFLVEKGADPNEPLQRGGYGSALIEAAARGETKIVKFLVANGADLHMSFQYREHDNALAAAVESGKSEIIEFLVEKGANVNEPLQCGYHGNALALAAARSDARTVKFLVAHGADVNMSLQSGEYGSALAAAVHSGESEIVEFFVEKGANVNEPLQRGRYGNALTLAAARGETKIVKFLVEKGADVNMPLQSGDYGSALTAAITEEHGEIIDCLVDRGADVNMPLLIGGSALAVAIGLRSPPIIEFLVANGADVNLPLQSGDYGSALAAAVASGWVNIVEFLVEKGARVNEPLQSGRCGSALAATVALERNIINKRTEPVEFLLERGADVNMPLQIGGYGSLLAGAAATGSPYFVEFLIQKGADVNMQLQSGKCGSALAAAAYLGKMVSAEALINAGAKVNLRLENGAFSTALQAARADVSQEDRVGRSWNAEFWKKRKAEVAELLQQNGATDEV